MAVGNNRQTWTSSSDEVKHRFNYALYYNTQKHI